MIRYNDFELSESQIAHIKRMNLQMKAYKYAKVNSDDLPDGDSYYVASDEDLKKYKDAYYALQYEPLSSGGMEFSNGKTRDEVEPGDIVYFEGTPIGVVVIAPSMVEDGIGRMASLPVMSRSNPRVGYFSGMISGVADADYRMCVNTGNDVEALTNYGTKAEAITDMDGKGNTLAILNAQSFYTDYESVEFVWRYKAAPAAVACHIFQTTGTSMGDWYLPSAGEMNAMLPYLDDIVDGYSSLNEGLITPGVMVPLDTILNAVPFGDVNNGYYGGNFGQWYWTSTEYNATIGWYCNTVNNSIGISTRGKTDENAWGVIKAFCHF